MDYEKIAETILCLRKGMEGLRVPRARQDVGTHNPSIPFLRHKKDSTFTVSTLLETKI